MVMKIKITKIDCKRCKHEWVPKKEIVRVCPKCHSAWFDEDRNKRTRYYICKRCNHQFDSDDMPPYCLSCDGDSLEELQK